MRLFLKSFFVAGFFCALILSSMQVDAQYFVPQDKKTNSRPGTNIFKRKAPPAVVEETRKPAPSVKDAPSGFYFTKGFESSAAHMDNKNLLELGQVYGGEEITNVADAGGGDCSAQQKSALRAIQKYADRKAKGLLPTDSDKKVGAFMAVPDNAQKAQDLARRCNMELGL